MGLPAKHPPTLLLLAAFSRHAGALDWARQRAAATWGPLACESPAFAFNETAYYQSTMGTDLQKIFWAFARPFDPADLVDVKLLTNQWEEEYAATAGYAEPRPLNLDPGYLTLAKLVLASTKDFAHRIYLSRGIFAEITLYYKHHHWLAHEYTFPDYRRADYQQFFDKCRTILQERKTG